MPLHTAEITLCFLLTQLKDIPNGTHQAKWSGNLIHFSTPDGKVYQCYCTKTLRGMDIPCTITTLDGNVTVTTHTHK